MSFGSMLCIPSSYSITTGDEGNGGGEEGCLSGRWKLGFLGSGDFLALVMMPGEMSFIKSADGTATSLAGWIGWLGEVRVLRVVTLRPVLPRSGGARLRRLLMGYIEKGCWKLLNAARYTHLVLIIIAKGFGDPLLD